MNNENLWAPWRMAYLRELQRKADAVGWDEVSAGGFFEEFWDSPKDDVRNLVIYRNEHGIILLNRYPYANGHLMTALGDAQPTILDYKSPQRAEFWRLIEISMKLMHETLSPQGINVGINEGRAAGAGVPEHLHAHIVPRWHGDTNFMTVAGNVRVIPEALEKMAAQYRETGKSITL